VSLGGWRNRSSGLALPLFRIQAEIPTPARRASRPGKLCRRAAPLNRDALRISGDIADIPIIFAKRNHNCRNYWFGVRVPCRYRLSGR
jgi:hypothetical protein